MSTSHTLRGKQTGIRPFLIKRGGGWGGSINKQTLGSRGIAFAVILDPYASLNKLILFFWVVH